jgi:hypothetical protein
MRDEQGLWGALRQRTYQDLVITSHDNDTACNVWHQRMLLGGLKSSKNTGEEELLR